MDLKRIIQKLREEKMEMSLDLPPPPPAMMSTAPNYHKKAPLHTIAIIESSAYTNKKHDTLQSGTHAGMHSRSRYGIMPLTAVELLKDKKFASTATGQKIAKATAGDPYKNWEQINKVLENPRHDTEAAAHLWSYKKNQIKKFAPKDADLDLLTAFSHYHGVGGTRKALREGGLDRVLNHPYVQKFRKAKTDPKLQETAKKNWSKEIANHIVKRFGNATAQSEKRTSNE